jgi:hypothetical protein
LLHNACCDTWGRRGEEKSENDRSDGHDAARRGANARGQLHCG